MEVLANTTVPKTKKEVKSFLAMVNYYRSFLPALSDLATISHDLTKDGVKFDWNGQYQQNFERIKELISKDIMHTHLKGGVMVHVYTDASDTAICGVLLQEGRMLFSVHRKLSGLEIRYS